MAATRLRRPGHPRRPGRRRIHAIAAPLATVALIAGVTAGCDAAHKALDCVRTADAVADSITDLQESAEHAALYPHQADRSVDDIKQNLHKIGDRTDDADLNKAVDDLDRAVDNVRTAVKHGDNTPDLSPVTDAAGELSKTCTS
ncbi:hypothetical protein [Streptomyces sp. NPDC005423]|uniref:hypothetical protein n=1 Tax=Streptomyces sp. NPDC005423 TaxID=3155343 RepID=UPI0033A1411F